MDPEEVVREYARLCRKRQRLCEWYENPNHKRKRPCALAPHCGCHGFRAPPPEAMAQHEAEVGRRLAWCVREGRVPAFEHLHEAPGDDAQFVYGVPPWKPDGSPNPAGVPFTPEDAKLAAKPTGPQGYECRRCFVWVPIPPRAYLGGEEPWNWWFCMKCKAEAVKPAAKKLKADCIAQQCKSIRDYTNRISDFCA